MIPDEAEVRIANIAPFGLRLQPDLKRRIEEAAKRNGRSLNSEISIRLELSLDAEVPDFTSASLVDLVAELRTHMEEQDARIRALELRAKIEL